MPKPLAEYTFSDWLCLRPLTHKYKTLRYGLINSLYMRRPARGGDPGAAARCLRGKKVLITVAYRDPQVIEWQIQLMRAYVSKPLHLIADNSPDDACAALIESITARHGNPYLRLPANPWKSGSRSHGISLNWLWRNLILPGQPEAFGFLDHDLFPTAPEDPFEALATQDCYGLVRTAGPRWFLWAGFCLFKFDAVREKPLDFGQDWFAGLDTGGGNWEVLYRHIDRAGLRQPLYSIFPLTPGSEVSQGAMDWCGSWLHEMGSREGRPGLAAEKRRLLAHLLAPHFKGKPS